MALLIATIITLASISYVVNCTEIGRLWKRGLHLLCLVTINATICTLFVFIASGIIYLGVSMLCGAVDNWFSTIAAIVALVFVPLLFPAGFEEMYSHWKYRSKSPLNADRNLETQA